MAFPWPVYRCKECGSAMLDNEAWEEHMRSRQRLALSTEAEHRPTPKVREPEHVEADCNGLNADGTCPHGFGRTLAGAPLGRRHPKEGKRERGLLSDLWARLARWRCRPFLPIVRPTRTLWIARNATTRLARNQTTNQRSS